MDEAGLRKMIGSSERKVEQTTRTYGEDHALTQQAREELKVTQAEQQRRAQEKPTSAKDEADDPAANTITDADEKKLIQDDLDSLHWTAQ